MPRVNNVSDIRQPVDILHRASRPQRHSSWLPRHRDWRYESGIFEHDDHADAPKQLSVWDELDYDAQIGVFRRERRRVVGSQVRQDGRGSLTRRSSGNSEVERGSANGIESTMRPAALWLDGTVESSPEKVTPKANEKTSEMGSNFSASAGNTITAKACPRAHTIALFQPSRENADGEEAWEHTRLIASLRFTSNNIAALQRVLNRVPPTARSASITANCPTTPTAQTAPQTPTTVSTYRILDSIESVHANPLFERQWKDETQNFSMRRVVESLRPNDTQVEQLPALYNWFPEAVPIDAVFPPGVPLSAKEIHAFYPHHVRWKDVMLRLVNNDYRGPDIVAIQSWFRADTKSVLTGTQMNQILRDSLRRALPSFKTADGAYKGKPDRNLYTDQLRPGKYVEETRGGYVAPTFDDLLEGLAHLPTGLDARHLTQCLVWYLNVRDMFSPRLELNVLHAQSLIRALRHPLKAHGQRNLDKIALEEWKRNGKFVEREVKSEACRYQCPSREMDKLNKSKMELNVDDESVKLHLCLPIRHVFMFPFLAMVNMAAKGIEMGIAKAEQRRAVGLPPNQYGGEEDETTKAAEPMEEPTTNAEQPMEQAQRATPLSYRIPKRPRPTEEDQATQPHKKRVPTSPRLPTAPRQPSTLRNLSPALPLHGHWRTSFNTDAGPRRYAIADSVPAYYHHQAPHTHATTYPRREPSYRGPSYPRGQPHSYQGGQQYPFRTHLRPPYDRR